MNWFNNGIAFFGCVIEVFLLYDYFSNFFELKIRKKYAEILFWVTCIAVFAINMIGNANINLLCCAILLWIFISILFKSKIGIRLGYFISAYVVMIGVEFLYLILSRTTSDMVEKAGVIPVSDYGWQLIFIKFLNYIVFLILKQTSSKSHSKMKNKLFLLYLCVPVSSFGTMITIFYSGIDLEGSKTLRIVMTLFFISMVIGNIVVFYAFQKHTEEIDQAARQKIEIHYKNAEIERLTKITELNDNYNEAMHNMSHSLKVIEQLAIENNVEEIKGIVENLTDKISQREIYEYSSHKMLNTILSEYAGRAEKSQINYDVYVEPGCILKQIKDIDLVTMLGNILDNAFEAASKAENPSIGIRIFMHEKGKICIVKVVNDYVHELKMKNGKVVTSKEDAGVHGIGLKSISKTAEIYNGSFSYYTENKKFYAVLLLSVNTK